MDRQRLWGLLANTPTLGIADFDKHKVCSLREHSLGNTNSEGLRNCSLMDVHWMASPNRQSISEHLIGSVAPSISEISLMGHFR
jgi:hypothetical protein